MKYLRYLLFPVSWIYTAITQLRNVFFTTGILKQKQFSVPVIVVGNLSTGGTGKSPMVDYLLKLISPHAIPASLSRGYGRKTKGFLQVTAQSRVSEVGDEPLMLKQANPAITVCVDENRVHGIEQILRAFHQTNIMVLDDAYQHRYVKPSFTILLTTHAQPFYNDFVLPMGNLRELRKNAARANAVVITKCPSLSKAQQDEISAAVARYTAAPVFFAGLKYTHPTPAFSNADLPEKPEEILLVTGIANAQSLVEHCNSVYSKVHHLQFPDHHQYTSTDFTRIAEKFNSFAASRKMVLTTQKDLVKWKEAGDTSIQSLPVFYQPVEMVLFNAETFNKLILEHVGQTQ